MRNTVKKSEFTGLTKKVDVNDVPAYFRTNKYFAGFLAKMTEGDELWEYDDIGFLCGSAGYVIIRGDDVLYQVQTMMS